MKSRRKFIQQVGILSTAALLNNYKAFAYQTETFKSKRPSIANRKFTSDAVEATILDIKRKIADPELAWLFENCFANTLDTTVDFEMVNGKPDTYVITGDIDAMWLRDSSAQVWPYLPLIKKDKKLNELIAGVIHRQKKCILLDPYANAFYKDPNKISEWKNDLTKMKPGIHERKWEIDSLCYPIRLAYKYWNISGETSVFDTEWVKTIELTVQTFKEQQRKTNLGPYSFQRTTAWATDGVAMSGYGYPVKPTGLICSLFRPSDDACIYSFHIPANFFAIVSLRQAAEMLHKIHANEPLAKECNELANEVEKAIYKNAIVDHPDFGKIFAYEINGFGSTNLMDDANVPSLLALPYLDAIKITNPIYINTRKYVLSNANPFYFTGKVAEGTGGPHAGMNMIWPIGIIVRGLTTGNEAEIRHCLHLLKTTHADTGFIHESFDKDDAKVFTRKWFAWANTLFGEFIINTNLTHPTILGVKNI